MTRAYHQLAIAVLEKITRIEFKGEGSVEIAARWKRWWDEEGSKRQETE